MPRDRSKLSQRPEQIRNRLRRGGKNINEDLEMLAQAQGAVFKPLDEWTFEELAAGRPRNSKGKFNTGPKPIWMTPLIIEEIHRRLRAGWGEEVRAMLPTILKVLKQLLEDESNPRIQFDVAKLMLEYAVGAPVKNVAIESTSRVETLLADVIVLDDGEVAHPIIDGQFYDEDEEDV